MNFYDQIDQVPYPAVQEQLKKAKEINDYNFRAINNFYIDRDGKSPFFSPYFKIREEDKSGYIGNTQHPGKQYYYAWSYKIGSDHPGYQDLHWIGHGHCNNVLAFDGGIDIVLPPTKKVYMGSQHGAIHVFVGPSSKEKDHVRIDYTMNYPALPLNGITLMEIIEQIDITLKQAELMEKVKKYLVEKPSFS